MHSNMPISEIPIPPWWTSRFEQISKLLDANVPPECLRLLATSPGRRAVKYAAWGEDESSLRGQANQILVETAADWLLC